MEPVAAPNEAHPQSLATEEEQMSNEFDEEYPGQLDEMRRQRLIREAVRTADRIILGGSDGSVEEALYLTTMVAHAFAEKVRMSITAALLNRELKRRYEK